MLIVIDVDGTNACHNYLMLYMIHLIVTLIVVDYGGMNIIVGEIGWTIDGD